MHVLVLLDNIFTESGEKSVPTLNDSALLCKISLIQGQGSQHKNIYTQEAYTINI